MEKEKIGELVRNFADAWRDFERVCYAIAKEKGWWDRFVRFGSCSDGAPHELVHNGRDTLVCRKCGDSVFGEEAVEILFGIATDRNKGETIALIHSELSELLEGLRQGDPPNDQLPEFRYSAVEVADVLIRLADICHGFDWDVSEAVVKKTEFNMNREYRHGRKF